MRLTTARYYTPSGRSIQALGIAPDIVVEQPPRAPESTEDEAGAANHDRSEADLRGSLENAEEAAKLRLEDYQLAYAIDILKGLSAISVGAAPTLPLAEAPKN